MRRDIYITDLMDTDMLQRIQDAFSELTGMAALTTDVDGKPVTEGSHFTDFCMKYVRTSENGSQYCEWCDKFGAEQTYERGHQATYVCHAGLIDFAAPITVGGKQVGCFIGGQVLTKKLSDTKIRQVAARTNVDPDVLREAMDKVNILPKSTIDRAAQFLYEFAAILSDIAYSKYVTEKAEQDMEKAAQMKSDFLANMSHEIRTPMNAVIGMAEMALREDLPQSARYYINQIKSSGRELLTIINDILDFSKIESGKLDIIPVEYETMSVINDVSNVIVTRLKGKDVELIVKLDPKVPRRLLGDSIRIKQILINIANNAVKFTNEGKITISLNCHRVSPGVVDMLFSVEDTGIGIKEEDLPKLFQSFQQVDSKRNRNIEGTGLGLAISQQLVQSMGGEIQVESVYGAGSMFSFNFPQQIIDDTPSIELEEPDKKAVAAMIANGYVREQIAADCRVLGVSHMNIDSEEALERYAADNSGKELSFLVEKDLLTDAWEEFMNHHPDMKTVVLTDFYEDDTPDIANLLVMKKPVYLLNLAALLRDGDLYHDFGDSGNDSVDFIAPQAEVLVVDDNTVNLTIAEGLLQPLQMKIQTAISGKEAVDKAKNNHFDIIFMDHMMPEMDGIEAAHFIREFEEYKEKPIIALTANAVSGVREKFLSAGMNDFIAKPIEVHTLISKVKKWLPPEKIQVADEAAVAEEEKDELPDAVANLDVQSAVKMLGSKKMYFTILENYYKAIPKKADMIRRSWEQEDWKNYTIEVHALKSLSRQVGADALADLAAELEKAGNENNIDYIMQYTDELLTMYLDYIPMLKPYFRKEESEEVKEEIVMDVLRDFLSQLREAADNLDMDQMEMLVSDMEHYTYADGQQVLFEHLKEAVEGMDTEASEAIIQEWEECL